MVMVMVMVMVMMMMFECSCQSVQLCLYSGCLIAMRYLSMVVRLCFSDLYCNIPMVARNRGGFHLSWSLDRNRRS